MTMKKEELKCFICGQALELVDASAQKEHMDYGRHNDRPFFNVCRECQQLIGLARPPQSWQYPTEEQAALLR